MGFAVIYRYGPNVRERFVFISPGSVVGAALLIAASLGYSLYAGHFADYDATYGSIGAVITLMLWLYIAGLVILLGSEINVLLRRYGRSRHQRPLTAKE
nr:YihY/virulence factor BrkB family protein [Azospirillum sp. Sh1]